MSSDRLPELYHEALDLAAPEREALLARVRTEDPSLAAELERLLVHSAARASPIDRPAFAALGLAGSSPFAPAQAESFPSGAIRIVVPTPPGPPKPWPSSPPQTGPRPP